MPAEPNGTEFEFVAGQKPRTPSDVLLVPLVTKPRPPLPLVKAVDDVCGDAVSALLAVQAAGAEAGHLAHTTSAGPLPRILVVDLGPTEKLTGLAVRQAAASAARWLIAEKLTSGAVWLDPNKTSPYDCNFRFSFHVLWPSSVFFCSRFVIFSRYRMSFDGISHITCL
jgi:hypothetical protein